MNQLGPLGNLALMGALAFAAFACLCAMLAALRSLEPFRKAAARSLIACFLCVLTAVACLATLLVTSEFHFAYVFQYSNLTLPTLFKLTAVWGGHQGSLLWWTLILATYSAIFLRTTRKLPNLLLAWSYFFIALALFFFLLINNYEANPFEVWNQVVPEKGLQPFFPEDGRGLNPQLHHWAMILHPPLLYAGYVGFLFPFALTFSALLIRLEGRAWIPLVRTWTLLAWLILSVGIVLGGAWAYMELGWGGYWAWDPVENASFMPWLLATAFLHSVMAQETRGLFKLWNVCLIALSYLLCMFGTFITRSGLISSVHAFAESDIWVYYLVYILLHLLLALIIIWLRRDQLRDDQTVRHATSREASLLFNNILFVSISGSMLLATLYPILNEWIYEHKRELRHGFYNQVELPIFLVLLLLMAVGPILSWKKAAAGSTWRKFRPGIIGAALAALACLPIWPTSRFAFFSFPVLTFLLLTLAADQWSAVGERARRSGTSWPASFLALLRRNPRRHGGAVVHLGVFLVALGITGSAFNLETKADLAVGETIRLGSTTFQVAKVEEVAREDYVALKADVHLLHPGGATRVIHPEQRFYKASQSQASEVAILSSALRDTYVVLAGMGEGSSAEHPVVALHLYINPLTLWVWVGSAVLVLGTLLAMLGHRLPAGKPGLGENP